MAKQLTPEATPIERALKDAAKDRSLADEFRDAANLQELHALCTRMIEERERIAKAFDGVVRGWSMLSQGSNSPDPSAVEAVERIAMETIAFAREVVQAFREKQHD